MEFFVVHAPNRDSNESSSEIPDILSIGELHRCILAKLTQKEIKRAINKYKDLMPKESDWNRKLSESAKKPELGFRYLFRCGQIDDNNNRTLQKMLKYMERYDILPYFHSLMHQGNVKTSSCHPILKDSLDEFMKERRQSNDNVLVSPVYEISRTKSRSEGSSRRTTRSLSKKLREELLFPKEASKVSNPASNNDSSFLHRIHSTAKINRKKSQFVPIWNLGEVKSSSQPVLSASGSSSSSGSDVSEQSQSKLPVTCDLSMRVRAEYHTVRHLLDGRIVSHRADQVFRQLDVFSQSANVLRSHDLGDIMCHIRFSDLHYLEAFWRDYRSGELAKAIKTVFVKDYLTRTNISPEDVHVFVAVDQRSYISGRDTLLKAYNNHYEKIDFLNEQHNLFEENKSQSDDDLTESPEQFPHLGSHFFQEDSLMDIDTDSNAPEILDTADDLLESRGRHQSPHFSRGISRTSSSSSMLHALFRSSSFSHSS